ncbi:hypothetical protein [Schlesneria sp. T3-172]|uniref:hypothetical protein n=1 Tax=Schlesneria sphaerica TaxID=3373610 RepID=UPI0037C80F07
MLNRAQRAFPSRDRDNLDNLQKFGRFFLGKSAESMWGMAGWEGIALAERVLPLAGPASLVELT